MRSLYTLNQPLGKICNSLDQYFVAKLTKSNKPSQIEEEMMRKHKQEEDEEKLHR